MDDYTITMPFPFTMGGAHNLVLCQSCGQESYASEFFGIDAEMGLTGVSPDWVKGLRHGSQLEDPEADMTCPSCGARKGSNLGRRIMNFLIGESGREQ